MADRTKNNERKISTAEFKPLMAGAGIKRRALAKMCEVSEAVVTAWENGTRQPPDEVIETLKSLAELQQKPDGKIFIDALLQLKDYDSSFMDGGSDMIACGPSDSDGDNIAMLERILSGDIPLGAAVEHIKKLRGK